jgi:hypothetical protein
MVEARGFIEHQSEGLVIDPEPTLIAEALDSLYLDRKRAQTMGARGLDKIKKSEPVVESCGREIDRCGNLMSDKLQLVAPKSTLDQLKLYPGVASHSLCGTTTFDSRQNQEQKRMRYQPGSWRDQLALSIGAMSLLLSRLGKATFD